MNDTIAAISTTLGVGAISIIRISGLEAIKEVNKITKTNILDKESHTITYTYIEDNNETIDEVLVTIMKAPKTFTREDIVEINCHGGIATTKKVLELLLKQNIRLAEPGEFTKRAFLNGRIDLTQAEAVMDLINVKSDTARQIAISNLKGNTTKKIRTLREKLSDILANIEVNIDYPEYQDIEEMTTKKIKNELDNIKNELDKIIENSKNSKIIKDGINVAIIGRPNVGKSSILNMFSGYDKAIVTEIAGTTRDVVEESIILDGIGLNLIDTAGIRQTKDIVEQIGVERSKQAVEKADLILLVLNNNEQLQKEDKDLLELSKNKKRIIIINKNDLEKKIDINNIEQEEIVTTNTLNDDGIKELKEKIKEMFNLDKIETKDYNYVSNINQLKKVEEAEKSIENIRQNIENDLPIDIIEIDLKYIWDVLGEVIGETYQEELLDNLFSKFCVGK
jgi:tRNA modification GTPase